MLKREKRILNIIQVYQLFQETEILSAEDIAEITGLPLRSVYRILADFLNINILKKENKFYLLNQ